MSLHFDFALACYLKPDTPQEVLDTLQYMTRSEDYEFGDPPDHPFFKGEYWSNMLQIRTGTAHFPGEFGSIFRRTYRYTQADADVYRYTLSFRCHMLEEEFHEKWWAFAQWIAPYSETVGCVGYYREEFDWQPTLIYFRDGKVYVCEVTQTPLDIQDGKPW